MAGQVVPEGVLIDWMARLRLEPGDVIVCRLPEDVPADDQRMTADTLAAMRRIFPGHDVLVLSHGAEIEVIKP